MCRYRRSRSQSPSRDLERAKRERMRERRAKGLPPFKEEHLISKLCALRITVVSTQLLKFNNTNNGFSSRGHHVLHVSFIVYVVICLHLRICLNSVAD